MHVNMSPFLFLLLLLNLSPLLASAQVSSCTNGVSILYELQTIVKSYPYEADPANQPYAFTANLQIFNAGEEDLKGWTLFIGYVNKEVLVDASGASVADGTAFPANASQGINLTSSGTLKTGIDTAMDSSLMGVNLTLKGTEFGQDNISMPVNITLINSDYNCSEPNLNGTTIQTCCTKAKSTVTLTDNNFFPRYTGDITMSYDILKVSTDHYTAQVTMSSDSPKGRLDYWNLQWTWQHGEFIYSMKGAVTTEQDQNTCILGDAETNYASMDFSTVTSCQSRPTIIDLDQYKANDSTVGQLEYCCRNGTLLPALQDPSKSKSVFQLLVYKLPPQNQNSTLISPPQKWNLSGTFDVNYNCDSPRPVQPTAFTDVSTAQRTESAVMSWQVTCNATTAQVPSKCCVSFSDYNNDSIVPCKTCACGCASQLTCNSSAEALLIPTDLATVPFVNRTAQTLAWAKLKHWSVPQVLPCPDNCGVSINWHLLSNYTNGWSARMTVFNWQGLQFADWSAAVELGSTYAGFQKAYSFSNSTPGNNTIYLFGLEGQNYLNGIYNNYPGYQQSVISFTIDGVESNSTLRDFYPTKVFFDGNECALPDILPSSSVGQISPIVFTVLVLPMLLLWVGPFGIL